MMENDKKPLNIFFIVTTILMLLSFGTFAYYYLKIFPGYNDALREMSLELPLPMKLSIQVGSAFGRLFFPAAFLIIGLTALFIYLKNKTFPIIINLFLFVFFAAFSFIPVYSISAFTGALNESKGIKDGSVTFNDHAEVYKKESVLELKLKTDKDVYDVNEQVILLFEVNNKSSLDQKVSTAFEPGGNIVFRVGGAEEGAKGYLFPKKEKYDLGPPADKTTQMLPPGESITGKYTIPANFLPPGKYSCSTYMNMYHIFKHEKIYLPLFGAGNHFEVKESGKAGND